MSDPDELEVSLSVLGIELFSFHLVSKSSVKNWLIVGSIVLSIFTVLMSQTLPTFIAMMN